MQHTIHITLAVLVLAGCSSATDSAQQTQPPATEAAASPSIAQPMSIADLPVMIRCEGFDDMSEEAPEFVAEYGSCHVWGDVPPNSATLYGFATEQDMASFWAANEAEGLTPEQAATVGLLVVLPEVATDLPKIKEDLGLE